MVIKNPPKISPGLIFGGAYYRDDICVKNQGGLFSGGGGGGLLSGFYGMSVYSVTLLQTKGISYMSVYSVTLLQTKGMSKNIFCDP